MSRPARRLTAKQVAILRDRVAVARAERALLVEDVDNVRRREVRAIVAVIILLLLFATIAGVTLARWMVGVMA